MRAISIKGMVTGDADERCDRDPTDGTPVFVIVAQIIRLGTAAEDFSFHLEQENLDLVMDKVSEGTELLSSWLINPKSIPLRLSSTDTCRC